MNLLVAIVGLPNVGKSTLFNALLRRQMALAANYPFATIDPNKGIVEVKDQRIDQLAKIIEKTVGLVEGRVPRKYATIEFVDIAGLVAGASKGEGLGNQFLANIRETDLICHVLRAFEDSDVILTGKLDPKEDLAIVRMELILKDLETVEKQERSIKKLNDKLAEETYKKVRLLLEAGRMANSENWWNEKEREWLKSLHLLTAKKEIFVVNVSESQLRSVLNKDFHTKIGVDAEEVVYISAQIESELCVLSDGDQKLYMVDLGLSESGIEQMAKLAYRKLGLISFLTAGEIECRAWTIKQGTNAQQAAGVIHQDFVKNFIKAKVCAFDDFVQYGGWIKAAEAGKVRHEGRDYVIHDGDVVEFMIGR